MAELEKRIEKDLNEALRQKDKDKVSTLRLLRAAIENKFIQQRKKELKQEEIIQVIKKETNKIKDSIEAFEKGHRGDLVEKEKLALDILEEYLPAEISDDEIRKYINRAIDQIKPEGKKDFGRLMAQIMGELKGRADGKKVSQLVAERLSKLEKEN